MYYFWVFEVENKATDRATVEKSGQWQTVSTSTNNNDIQMDKQQQQLTEVTDKHEKQKLREIIYRALHT